MVAIAGLLAAVLLASGPAPAQTRSTAPGTAADTIRFPYVAALSRTTGDERVYFCAGALVAPRWILTAAHCFVTPDGQTISAARLWAEAGAPRLTGIPDPAQVRVARIISHPDFDPATQANDLALIELADDVGPLVVAMGNAADVEPDHGILLGFAALYEGDLARTRNAQARRDLRQGEVQLVDPARCAAQLGARGAANIRCGTSSGGDACIGDSGGPLILGGPAGDRIAGVVSFGRCDGNAAPLIIFTNVAAYAGWIDGVIAGRR